MSMADYFVQEAVNNSHNQYDLNFTGKMSDAPSVCDKIIHQYKDAVQSQQ